MILLRRSLFSIRTLAHTPRRTASFVSHLRTQREVSKRKLGLFGLAGLHQPEDWHWIADKCVSDCLRLAEEIQTPRRHVSVKVLQTSDDLSDRLCSVLAVAELCRNVHPDPEFVEAANGAFFEVSDVTKRLNSDYTLYRPLHHLLEEYEANKTLSTVESELSSEDLSMMKSLTFDFERGGIHLGSAENNHLLRLQGDVDALSARFLSHPTTRPSTLLLPSSIMKKTPLQFQSTLRASVDFDFEKQYTRVRGARNPETMLSTVLHGRAKCDAFLQHRNR